MSSVQNLVKTEPCCQSKRPVFRSNLTNCFTSASRVVSRLGGMNSGTRIKLGGQLRKGAGTGSYTDTKGLVWRGGGGSAGYHDISGAGEVALSICGFWSGDDVL